MSAFCLSAHKLKAIHPPPLPQSNVPLSPLVQLERPPYKQPQRRFVDSTQSFSFLDPSSSPRDEMSHVGVDNVDKENEDEVVYGGVNEHAHDIDGQESTADEIEEEEDDEDDDQEEEEGEEEELDVSAEMIEANEFVEAEASSLSQI